MKFVKLKDLPTRLVNPLHEVLTKMLRGGVGLYYDLPEQTEAGLILTTKEQNGVMPDIAEDMLMPAVYSLVANHLVTYRGDSEHELINTIVSSYESASRLHVLGLLRHDGDLYMLHHLTYDRVCITVEDADNLGRISPADNSQGNEPIPIWGKPETLPPWIVRRIREEGLNPDGSIKHGFQAQLIKESEKYGYKDDTVIKKAWAKAKTKIKQ